MVLDRNCLNGVKFTIVILLLAASLAFFGSLEVQEEEV